MGNTYVANILSVFLLAVLCFALYRQKTPLARVVPKINKAAFVPKLIVTTDCAEGYIGVVLDTPFLVDQCAVLHFKSTETNNRYEVIEMFQEEQIDIPLANTSQSIFIVATDTAATQYFSQTYNIFCPKITSKKARPLQKLRRHQKPIL